ncbi:hypothetical protein NZD89_29070 (plasmid) [Alicyclobacillus fastidiosus]|uniref:Uncharacterized protein n=1 Tax=Alicyclobacillus fastidiosus TaxID=392011 RepID=A0ABY6ZQ48_9BACL|nr:hypothetical protein [Alicyclobacillus fastidiosus]WAH44967.1 hypothetical protein NZD89_29070 [Alicyclobacillus fastidiosus]
MVLYLHFDVVAVFEIRLHVVQGLGVLFRIVNRCAQLVFPKPFSTLYELVLSLGKSFLGIRLPNDIKALLAAQLVRFFSYVIELFLVRMVLVTILKGHRIDD